jgi:hypothetical protein
MTAQIRFTRWHLPYLLSALLLLTLPACNIAFMGVQAEGGGFAFNQLRNVINFLFPLPVYLFVGIIPGVIGFVVLGKTKLDSTDHAIEITQTNQADEIGGLRLLELRNKPGIDDPKKDLDWKAIKQTYFGKRPLLAGEIALVCILWFFAFFLGRYHFESVQATGSWFYLEITQIAWGTTFYAGIAMLWTVIVLFVSGGITLFCNPRKALVTLDSGTYEWAYSRIIPASFSHRLSKLSKCDQRTVIISGILVGGAMGEYLLPGFHFGTFVIPFALLLLLLACLLLHSTIDFRASPIPQLSTTSEYPKAKLSPRSGVYLLGWIGMIEIGWLWYHYVRFFGQFIENVYFLSYVLCTGLFLGAFLRYILGSPQLPRKIKILRALIAIGFPALIISIWILFYDIGMVDSFVAIGL